MASCTRAALVASLLLLEACGQVARPSTRPAADYQLYVAASTKQGDRVAVVDSSSRAIARNLPLGTPSPDRRYLYWLGSGRLIDSDPASGATLDTMPLPGAYQLPPVSLSGRPGGLSENGKWLTVESWDRGAQGLPRATHLVVLDTGFRLAPAHVDLSGFFEFDAISNDGERLYLLEYTGGDGYRVRVYNVIGHYLEPQVVVDKSDGRDSMAGVRVASVFSPGGHWQYTLYARQNDGPFIHALNLDGGFSACIFLPGPGYARSHDAFRWSLALGPGGDLLYASNGATGVLAELSVGDDTWPALSRVARIAAAPVLPDAPAQDVQAREFGGSASVVSLDGETIVTAESSGIVWLDAKNFAPHRSALDGWRVWSVGLSPDGRELYVLNDAGTIAQVSMTSGAVEARFDPGAGRPVDLMWVAPGV